MNLKKLNVGLVALLLGFGLVWTQSAFTEKTTMYGKTIVGSDVHWVSLDGLLPYSGSGPLPQGYYRCNIDETSTCLGEFSSPPEINDTPTGLETEGVFEVNP